MAQQDSKNNRYFVVFCWNVGNPSIERAGRQALWLRKQPADVIVLTECKQSKGCDFLKKYFEAFGYNVAFPIPDENEYGVLILSRHPIKLSEFSNNIGYLSSRLISIFVETSYPPNVLEIIGTYVPSRDSSLEKKDKKRRFLNHLTSAFKENGLSRNRLFCGDFNILEPSHIPHYPIFEDWEYDFYSSLSNYRLHDAFRHLNPTLQEFSWVGRTGDGYRYDHCFVSTDLLPMIHGCYYLHEPRLERLSDHSALITELFLHDSA
jgi:exodeoxyribonuclease-3